jgi:phospholipase C
MGTDRCPQIRSIVVLMMENHSFDNYLGTLGRGDGLPDPAPENRRRDGSSVPSHLFASTTQTKGVPSQSWRSTHIQYGGGANDGFVTAIEDLSPDADPTVGMGYWDERHLPFYYGLARTFPLADRWFSSLLGPTFPNRRFLLAATAHGLIDDSTMKLVDYPKTGTIFDLLNRHGISWTNYHHVPPARLAAAQTGARGRRAVRSVLGRVERDLGAKARSELRCTSNVYPLGLARSLGHLRHIDRFFADAATGRLPSVSIVDPDFASFSEENPQDIRLGESFAADVIRAVMQGPGWANSLLLWLYDEHGGYYDHVPPPAAVEPDDVLPRHETHTSGVRGWLDRRFHILATTRREDDAPGRYDHLGFRVPAVLVSPYGRPGHVSSVVYDHTSALKLIEEKWNLPPLTRRDAAATAPWEMLDLTAPPAFLDPPSIPAPAVPGGWRNASPPDGRP